MGKRYEELTPKLTEFISEQKPFFVGTAPLTQDGHVNISPKGMDSLKVLDSTTVAYLDVTGSGVETISHVNESGRLVFMFCAFEGKPIMLDITRIADSCGWNVPLYNYGGTRDYYQNFTDKLGPEGIREGQLAANMLSIDGLPGLIEPSK